MTLRVFLQLRRDKPEIFWTRLPAAPAAGFRRTIGPPEAPPAAPGPETGLRQGLPLHPPPWMRNRRLRGLIDPSDPAYTAISAMPVRSDFDPAAPQREAAVFYGLFLRGHPPELLRRDIDIPKPLLEKWMRSRIFDPRSANPSSASIATASRCSPSSRNWSPPRRSAPGSSNLVKPGRSRSGWLYTGWLPGGQNGIPRAEECSSRRTSQ